MRALIACGVMAGALLVAGCGSSQSLMDSVSSNADAAVAASDASAVALNWSEAAVDLAGYCLDQATDGSGDPNVAESATDRMVNIARGHAEETYDIEGVTYRQALSDKASDLQDCDADLTAKLDRALATLD